MADETVVYAAARVRTLEPERPMAEALAVRGGKVLAVGGRAEVLEQAGPGARVVELPGATVVPGLVDAHAHLAGLGRSLSTLSLAGAKTRAEALERIRQAPRSSYQGDWLLGRGWDQNDWADAAGEFPDRRMLDALFPGTPTCLMRVDGHAAWVSSEALRRAGIGKDTPDPPGGRIERDSGGEPTGILVDNAIALVEAALPSLRDEQLQAQLQAALARCAHLGLTGVHDAGVDLRTFELLRKMDERRELPLRVYAMADGQGADGKGAEVGAFLARGTFEGRLLTLRAVKLLADGALGSRGAALHEPYGDAPGHRGLLLLEPAELEARAKRFMERGFQVAIHAIGDRANTLALDVLERAAAAAGTTACRHRVEHVQILRPSDLPRFAKLGLIASMQPAHATSDMPWAQARVGPERIRGAYAWRSVLDAGARLAFGSDFPVEDPNPLWGLYAARTRQDALGRPEGGWMPHERLSGEEALAAFTSGAAYASFAEERRGRLAPGMDADFVALPVDPVEGDPRALLEARVLLTVVAGREVYRSPAVR